MLGHYDQLHCGQVKVQDVSEDPGVFFNEIIAENGESWSWILRSAKVFSALMVGLLSESIKFILLFYRSLYSNKQI